MNFNKNALYLVAATSISLLAGSAWAQDAKGGAALLSAVNGNEVVREFTPSPAPQGVATCLSFDGRASWDGEDDPDNTIIDLDIGAGNTLTGVGWDIGVATVGASWLSEATIQHSDSNGSADPNAINLNVGAGNENSGDQDFTSSGILDFSDNGLPDIVAGADGILRLQLFETFDDNTDAIDANYRNAAAPELCPGLALACTDQAACDAAVNPAGEPAQAVPVNNWWALSLLILLLAGLGFVAVRRIA